MLAYVDGDDNDPGTFDALQRTLRDAKRPAYYLAIPPALFGTVIKALGNAGLATGARVIVEKPFGRDLASATDLNRVARSVFPENAIFRIDHFLGKDVETFCALRIFMDSWRWAGVPWYLRSGKCLPETVTEILVELKPPPQQLFADSWPAVGPSNYLRFRLAPDAEIALAARVKRAGEEFISDQRELLLPAQPDEKAPYDRLLGDAMSGDGALFTREDSIEAAWSVVDPILVKHHRALPYQPGTWGPGQADELIAPNGRWHNPLPAATRLDPAVV